MFTLFDFRSFFNTPHVHRFIRDRHSLDRHLLSCARKLALEGDVSILPLLIFIKKIFIQLVKNFLCLLYFNIFCNLVFCVSYKTDVCRSCNNGYRLSHIALSFLFLCLYSTLYQNLYYFSNLAIVRFMCTIFQKKLSKPFPSKFLKSQNHFLQKISASLERGWFGGLFG